MSLYEFEGRFPSVPGSTFVHPQAAIIGNVQLGEGCFVGPGAAIRGDFGRIVIGNGTNIQDNCIIHADIDAEAIIGENVLIGHGAIVHGPCLIGEYVVIGMGAIVSIECEMGAESLLAAGSLLAPRTVVPPRKLAMGRPAQFGRDLNEVILAENKEAVKHYQNLAKRYKKTFKAWNGI